VIGERQREKETFGFCCCAITRCTLRQKGRGKKGFAFPDGRNEVPVTICTHTLRNPLSCIPFWRNGRIFLFFG
jgi:hypothetical protein